MQAKKHRRCVRCGRFGAVVGFGLSVEWLCLRCFERALDSAFAPARHLQRLLGGQPKGGADA